MRGRTLSVRQTTVEPPIVYFTTYIVLLCAIVSCVCALCYSFLRLITSLISRNDSNPFQCSVHRWCHEPQSLSALVYLSWPAQVFSLLH